MESVLGQMTLEEKLGQMIQPELGQLTAEDVTKFKIGSALNGAGIWPGGDRHASVAAWVETVDAFAARAGAEVLSLPTGQGLIVK